MISAIGSHRRRMQPSALGSVRPAPSAGMSLEAIGSVRAGNSGAAGVGAPCSRRRSDAVARLERAAANSSGDAPLVDSQAFREVMGSFPTGVTVVATLAPGARPVGLTVNSFTSVSLEPPLVLVCLDHASASHDPLLSSGTFSVNVLARDQEVLARRFASEPSAGRFEGLAWTPHGGAPVLEGAVAWLVCGIEATHAAGDHTIVVGRVTALHRGEGEALAFHRGAFASVRP